MFFCGAQVSLGIWRNWGGWNRELTHDEHRGSTLVELLVGLGILSVALLTTVTLSVEWLAREHVRGAARELQSAAQRARIEAIVSRPIRFRSR